MANFWVSFLLVGVLGQYCQGYYYSSARDPTEERELNKIYNNGGSYYVYTYPTSGGSQYDENRYNSLPYGPRIPYSRYENYFNGRRHGSPDYFEPSSLLKHVTFLLQHNYPVDQYSLYRARLIQELGKLIKMIRLEQTLQKNINREYDQVVFEALYRILKPSSTIPKAKMELLRTALLEFLLPNEQSEDVTTEGSQVVNATTTAVPKVTVPVTSGDANNTIAVASSVVEPTGQITTAGVAVVPGNNGTVQDQVPINASASATTVDTSVPVALSPTNLNLIKLLQVYGNKDNVTAGAENATVTVPPTPGVNLGQIANASVGAILGTGADQTNPLSFLG